MGEDEVARRVKEMRDEQLVDFIRETIVHLEVLADRLDHIADTSSGPSEGMDNA